MAPSRIIARNILREGLGISGAHSGSVRVAQERQFAVAIAPPEWCPDHGRRYWFRRWPGISCPSCPCNDRRTPWSRPRCAPRPPGCSRLAARCAVGRCRVGVTPDRRSRRRHSPWVKSDQVEPFSDPRRTTTARCPVQPRCRTHRDHRVNDQRPDFVSGRWESNQCQCRGITVEVSVIRRVRQACRFARSPGSFTIAVPPPPPETRHGPHSTGWPTFGRQHTARPLTTWVAAGRRRRNYPP